MSLEDSTALGSGTVQTEQNNPGAQAAPGSVSGQGGAPEGGSPPPGGEGSEANRSLAQGGGEERELAPAAKWPDTWRLDLAGGDEAKAKRFSRYSSPEGVAKAMLEAQDKIRSGQSREPLPENATPEQVTAWRKENGIPEAPDGYKIEPGDGLVFGEADKPMLEAFSKFAHERNWTPQQVNQGAAFVAQLGEQQRAAMEAKDTAAKEEAQHALMEEWGREYKPNLQNVRNVLDRHGEPGLADALFGAQGPDGVRLGNNPALLRFLGTLAREINPLGTVVPAGVQDGGKAASEELAALRAEMGDPAGPYWRGPDAEKKQARYRDLLTALDKQRARG